MPKPMENPDIRVEDYGSIVLLRPTDAAAREWLADHCVVESWSWFGGALACEPRTAAAIVRGAVADGLAVRS